MSKHTPGPWEAFRRSKRLHPNQWIIATLPTAHEQSLCTEEGDVAEGEDIFVACTTEANARLIAAAPELLDASKWALEFLKGFPGKLPPWGEALKAAVAKAEGKK